MSNFDLAALYPVDEGDLTRLRTRLAAAAERDDALDVAYRAVDSPVGPLLIAATPVGLVRVAFDSEGNDVVLQYLSDRISPRVLNAPAPRRCRTSTGRILLRASAAFRRGAGLAVVQGISPHGARASRGRHRLRSHGQLRHAGATLRIAQGGSGGRHDLCHQPDPDRRAVPPRCPIRWHVGAVSWRAGRQARIVGPRSRPMSVTHRKLAAHDQRGGLRIPEIQRGSSMARPPGRGSPSTRCA